MKNSKKKKRIDHIIAWTVTVVFSVLFIIFGNKLVSKDLGIFAGEDTVIVARVTDLGELVDNSIEGTDYVSKSQLFYAKVIKGEGKGNTVLAYQQIDSFSAYQDEEVSIGDVVTLYQNAYSTDKDTWVFGDYYRLDKIEILAAIFIILLLIFGRIKGFNTLVSLAFTVFAVFLIFVPAILNGYNIYLMTVIVSVYTIVMTLMITNGPGEKSITTILGCTFGVVTAAIFNIILSKLMRMSGIIDEHSVYLQYLSNGKTLDLKALIFAMTVIGALGAVMDVAMDISASLTEIHYRNPDLSVKELYKSGIRIGRDVMGTMANTLVLAYAGSSLCSTLLNITYSSSLLELMNREGVAVELLQSLVGSTAILLTIPLTSLVCSMLYSKHEKKSKAYDLQSGSDLK